MISLILNIIESSAEKFNKLYKKYKNYVFVICNNILKDTNLSEDAMQETFVSINNSLENITEYDSNRTKGYIAVIARNKSINIYNKEKNLVFVEDIFFENKKVEINILDNLYYENLLKLIRNLKIEYSNILILRYVHEMEYSEIAKTLEISEPNARKRVERAKKALKTALEGENNE